MYIVHPSSKINNYRDITKKPIMLSKDHKNNKPKDGREGENTQQPNRTNLKTTIKLGYLSVTIKTTILV